MLRILVRRLNKENNVKEVLKQLIFYFPVMIAASMLPLTENIVNAGLARLPSSAILISAYAIARSFMNLFQSPLHMSSPMVTTLANDYDSYKQVRRFSFRIAFLILLLMFIFSVTGLTKQVFTYLMGVQGETLNASVTIFTVLIIYPIGLRNKDFYQGVLLKFKKSILIPINSAIRILLVVLVVINIERLSFIPPAILAGVILLFAVYVEGILTIVTVKILLKNIAKSFESADQIKKQQVIKRELNLKYLIVFYFPLIITAFINTLNKPLVNATLARAIEPENAIASTAVAMGIYGMFLLPLNMFKQVPLNFYNINEKKSIRPIIITAFLLGALSSLNLVMISFTGIGQYIMTKLIPVDPVIAVSALAALKVSCFLPLIAVFGHLIAGILMKYHMTKALGFGKAINLITSVIGVVIFIWVKPYNSAVFIVYINIVALTLELIYLAYFYKKHILDVTKTTGW